MAQYTNDQNRHRKTFQMLAQKMDAGKTQSDGQISGTTAMTETRRNTFRQLASMTSRMDSTAYHTEKQKRISEILQGAQDYFANAQKKIDGMSWSTAQSVNDEVSRNSKRMLEEYNEVKQYLDAYGDKMDKDTYNSLMDSLKWMDQARTEVQSIVADRASYFGSFDSEDAYIKGAAEAADQRQQRYADNQKQIDELNAEWEAYEYDWTDAAQRETADKKYDEIQAAIQTLEAENLQYERGEGGYVTKTTDDHSKTVQNADFELRSANRDYKNPTREEIDLVDVMNDNSTWKWDESAGVYRDSFGNELAVDENNTYYNPVAQQTKVVDKLGLYLDTSEDDRIAAAMNTGEMREGIWTSVMREGFNGAWEYLSDKEKGIYYYYLDESQEKAYQYLDDMTVELNRRRTLDEQGKWQQAYDATSFLGKVGMNIFTVPSQLASGVVGNIDNAVNILSGNEINPYSSAHRGSHYSQTVRGATAEDLDATGLKIPVVDFTLGDLYQSGMSMVDSLAAMGLGGTYGGVLLAGGAAENEAYRLYQQGASTEQIALGAAAAGATEMIFESLSLGELDKIKNMKSPKTLGQFFKTLLVQGGVEASEEAITEVANTVANAFIMGSQSDWTALMEENGGNLAGALMDKTLDVLHFGLGGFFSGAGSGGIVGGTQYAYNSGRYRNIGNAVIGNTGSVERLTALANELDGISAYDLGKQAQSVSKKATSKNVGRLLSDINNTINEQNGKDLSARLQEKGIAADRANAIAEAVVAARSDSSSLTQEQFSLLEQVSKDTAVTDAVSEILDTEGSAAHQRTAQLRAVFSEVAETTAQVSDNAAGETAPTLQELAQQKVEAEYAQEDTAATEIEESSSAEGRILYDAAPVDIADVETAGKGKVTVKLTDGRSVDASALEFPDTGEAELWRVVGKYAEDAASARALLDEYRGGNLDAYKYARGVEEGFLFGKLNISPKQMEMEGSYVNLLNPMQRNMAYGQGQIAGKRQAQKRQAEATQRDPSRRRKGAIHYGYEGETLDENKLNPSQRVGVDFAKRLARRKGMTFYFYRSYMQNGVRVFKNPEGKIVKATKKGWYNPADGSIHIDLNCGDMGSTVLYTIAHELGHYIKDWSAAKFRILCGIVTEGFVARGQSIDELVLNKQAEYREMGVELTYEEAYEEVICSAMEGVIDDGRVMELLEQAEKKDMTLADRLRSALKDIAELIRETIRAYRDVEPESPEGRMVMKMGDLRKQIQEAFADALHDAGENYREGGKINTAQSGGVKNSIRTTEDGIKYVKLDGNIFLRPDGTEMSPREAYNALVGQKITLEDGDVITFVKKLPKRDVYKELFRKMPGYDPGIDVKAVSEAINKNIVEVITASSVQTRNDPQKHQHIGILDFDQREVYLADNQKSYRLELCIANLTDGTKIAYVKRFVANTSAEIAEKIKKAETAGQSRLNQPSKNSIRNPDSKVNKNSLRYQKNAAAQSHMAQQNASMAEDMEGLNQLVAAQQQRGGDGRLESGTLNAAATFLLKTASAKGEKTELIKLLNAFYQHVATSTEQTWESVREQAKPVVRWLMKHAVHTKQRSEYSQDILNHLRGTRINLDDVQKGEVAHLYGSFGAYRNSVMGSVILANDGMPLDSAWQELSEIYPDVFDRDMNAADMPDALADIIYRLRNEDTSELEYEYSREFVEQELLQRVYDSYWNASTLYSVADHYEKQIKQLKGKHRQRMQAVYARHRAAETDQQIVYRQRQEAARAHYEEQYQRREAEYRESRQKAVERHDQTQMRQKIKRVVRDLWKLQERAPKHRRTKEELRDFVDKAIKAAYLIWLERYDEYDMIRNGIDDKYLRGDEKRLFKECRELLEKHLEISDADTRWDLDAALQQAKDKAALDKELAKRMKILRDNGVFAEEFKRVHEMDAGQILKDLMDSYKKLQLTDSPYLANAYQEKVQIRLQEIMDDVGVKPIRNMTMQELEKLYEAYSAVLHVVRDANKTFADDRAGEVTTLGTKIVNELKGFAHKVMGRKFMETLRKTAWNNLTPAYVFRRIGSATLERLYKNMLKGMGTYGQDIAEAKVHWQQQAKKYGAYDWDMDKRTEFVDKTGTKFSLSLGQLMSLYALSRRQQALGHIEIGGIRLDSEDNYVENVVDRVLPKVMRDASVFKLDKAALTAVCSKLTPEQKAFVEVTQGYLSTVMAEKGNEVSMKLYGIRLFREKIYFPLRTANDTRYQSSELIDQNKRKNSGFTKEANPNANNAVVLSDFSKVWTSHVKQMSLYHGMTLPMEDMDRMLNFGRTFAKDENGNIKRDKDGNPVEEFEGDSISATLRNIWGEHPENYVRELMKQLNGGIRSDSAEDISSKMLSRFKKSAVAGSLSVWIQQWTSVFRSMAYIPMKYFFQKPMGRQREAIVAEMKKYCPIAVIKEMGGFDTGMGNSEHDYITMREMPSAKDLVKEPSKAKELIQEIKKHPVKRFDDLTGWLPGRADETTWAHIWTAVKRETLENHPELKRGSEEFYKVASDRFTEVINLTQVYDSVLSKSGLMRAKGFGTKMITQFASEPTVALNMAVDAMLQKHRTGKLQVGTAFALVGSVVANAMSSALIYAMRDDDEEETFWEKYSASLLGNLLDGLNPLTYIPIIRDIWSAAQGYDVKRSDMEIWGQALSSLEEVVRKYNDEDATDKERAEAWAGAADWILALFGVPAKNIRRELKGLGNLWKTLEADYKRDTTTLSMNDSLQETWWSSIPLLRLIKGETKAKKLLDAYVADDQHYVDRLRGTYKTEDAANNAVVREVKERFEDGKLTENQALEYLIEYAGKTDEKAKDYLTKWQFAMENPDTVLEDSQFLKYTEFAEPAGISQEIYARYAAEIKECKSDKDKYGKTISGSKKEKELNVINKLPISRQQKDALYLDSGYDEDKLDEAPWN